MAPDVFYKNKVALTRSLSVPLQIKNLVTFFAPHWIPPEMFWKPHLAMSSVTNNQWNIEYENIPKWVLLLLSSFELVAFTPLLSCYKCLIIEKTVGNIGLTNIWNSKLSTNPKPVLWKHGLVILLLHVIWVKYYLVETIVVKFWWK